MIREDWSIKKMLQTNWGNIFDGDADKNTFTAKNDEEFYTSEGLLVFYRVLLNSILYIQSKDADIISKLSPHRRAKQMNRREKQKQLFLPDESEKEVSKLDYELVGESISPLVIQRVVFEEDTKTEEASENAESRSDERKLAKRILVRGHWRNQAYGAQYNERKLIWIKPFYKGPEMAEMIERAFIVK